MEHKRAARNALKMQPKQSECSFLVPRLVAAARGAHLERNRTSTFSMTGPSKEKGGGVRAGVGFHSQRTWLPWLLLRTSFRTCLLSERHSPTSYPLFARWGLTHSALVRATVFWRFWEVGGKLSKKRKEKKKETTTRVRNTAARLNFQQQSEASSSGRRRSQQVPGITIHLSLTARQHLTACVQFSGLLRGVSQAP